MRLQPGDVKRRTVPRLESDTEINTRAGANCVDLAKVYLAVGDPAKAETARREALRPDPANPEATRLQGPRPR